ncbi:MAG: peptidylprolyl isomerase [Phycisphaerales bacterium]|nr:peptidylprolyl isomerase [Phycisphaerales bacterium]
MSHSLGPRVACFAAPLLLLGVFTACSGPGSNPDAFRGLDRADAYSSSSGGRKIGSMEGSPPATIDGEAVTWEQLRPFLAEAAGSAALDELTLERRLHREMDRRGLTLSDEAVALERSRAMQTLGAGAQGNGELLVSQIRARRGLGPERYASLLRRNAMLRALVADRVVVRPDQVELAWRVQHGEKLAIRLLVTPTERQAASLRQQVVEGDASQLEGRFIEVASRASTDPSSSRGGEIEPFSAADPAYESAVRAAADLLQAGQLSPIIAIRNGFAVIFLQRRVPADGTTLDEATAALTQELRLRQERLLMDELAAQLLAEAKVTTGDPSLTWSRQASPTR